ncbi:MAG: selenocysteine-specific translation elongation factor [Pseudomonadota bacterium]
MIIATAGHVDHGKTSLVKALTGVDTDRLPEEKKRSLTIDLGFAYMPVADSQTIGFIDVPGHERFIRNALCGLAGTDFVLFIVAADDGVMPQTREHLAIINLLGITECAVALTKIDRVSEDEIELATEEIKEVFAPTGLADPLIFHVSAHSGEGVRELRDHLLQQSRALPPREVHNNFRLAIDRRFDVSGAGLVVTGTVFSGRASVGDSVGVLGLDMQLRVRGIHAQNAEAKEGRAGQRCAINLAGPELRKEAIERGQWLTTAEGAEPVPKFDAELSVLPSEPRSLSNWTPVHVHLGAAETTGRVATLGTRSIAVGETGLAQLVLDEPIGAVHGDRFIIRDQSARRTIGGGRVIDLFPPKRGRSKPDRLAWLEAVREPDDKTALTDLLELAPSGVDLVQFAINRNLTAKECDALVAACAGKVVSGDSQRVAFAGARWLQLRKAVLARLKDWHESQPDNTGLGDNRIMDGTGIRMSRDLAAAVAAELVKDGALAREGFGVRLPTHTARLEGADASMWQSVEKVFKESGLRPITAREIEQIVGGGLKRMDAFMVRASRVGLVQRISKTRFVTPASLIELGGIAERLVAKADDHLLMVAPFRDESGVGRNMTIEILEYFDKQKFTQREGEGRRIIQAADKVFASR